MHQRGARAGWRVRAALAASLMAQRQRCQIHWTPEKPCGSPCGSPCGIPCGVPCGSPCGLPCGTPCGVPCGVPVLGAQCQPCQPSQWTTPPTTLIAVLLSSNCQFVAIGRRSHGGCCCSTGCSHTSCTALAGMQHPSLQPVLCL
jgi:hypothetical protein